MAQISSSAWVTPKAGMPVILMPFLMIQKISPASSSRSPRTARAEEG